MVVASLFSILLLREPATRRRHRERSVLPVRAARRLLAATSAGRNLILAGFLGQAAVYAVLVVFAPRVEEVTATAREATVWVGILQAVTWAAALIGAGWWGWRNDRGPAHRNFRPRRAGLRGRRRAAGRRDRAGAVGAFAHRARVLLRSAGPVRVVRGG